MREKHCDAVLAAKWERDGGKTEDWGADTAQLLILRLILFPK